MKWAIASIWCAQLRKVYIKMPKMVLCAIGIYGPIKINHVNRNKFLVVQEVANMQIDILCKQPYIEPLK